MIKISNYHGRIQVGVATKSIDAMKNAFLRFAVPGVSLMCCLTATSMAMAADKKTPAEVIPVTAANLRGHESLYHEGWFIVSSTDKALRYAKEHAITSSGE